MRALFRLHPTLAGLLIAAALAVKMLVPTGYMPVTDVTGITLQLCPGTAEMAQAPAAMAHHAMAAPAADHRGHMPASKAEMPCAFAGLAAPVLAAVDAVLLAVAIAYVAAVAVRTDTRPAPPLLSRLRPPLRAPPLPAR
ncbi:hypothetical protein ACT009_00605 [Sphingomonas sp. Tas61C01]|uniref:hypothetical protein n=1 Tax=Sphingomonas sp. Tas61C01 TaxID=3458297 RepID=UPI00403E9C55